MAPTRTPRAGQASQPRLGGAATRRATLGTARPHWHRSAPRGRDRPGSAARARLALATLAVKRQGSIGQDALGIACSGNATHHPAAQQRTVAAATGTDAHGSTGQEAQGGSSRGAASTGALSSGSSGIDRQREPRHRSARRGSRRKAAQRREALAVARQHWIARGMQWLGRAAQHRRAKAAPGSAGLGASCIGMAASARLEVDRQRSAPNGRTG